MLMAGLAVGMVVAGCGGDDDKPTEPPPPPPDTEPVGLFALNGDTLLGIIGSDSLNPALAFKVNDSDTVAVADVWIYFFRTSGDGTLAADSAQTDSTGVANVGYTFDGDLGYASIVAVTAQHGQDTVTIRASVLTPGPNGQGQYVRFADIFNDIVNLNGTQEGATPDPRPGVPIWYVEYEQREGMVFMVLPPAGSSPDRIYPNSDVFGAIVTTAYGGSFANGIGIGSTYDEIKTTFGEPDTIYLDLNPPPAITMAYTAVPPGQMYFYLDTVATGAVDTTTAVFEIHLNEFDPSATPLRPVPSINATVGDDTANRRGYRLYNPR